MKLNLKINLPIDHLKRQTSDQLVALIRTGDDWLLPETLEAARAMLAKRQARMDRVRKNRGV